MGTFTEKKLVNYENKYENLSYKRIHAGTFLEKNWVTLLFREKISIFFKQTRGISLNQVLGFF